MNRLVVAIVATAAIAYPACAQQQGQRQPAANQSTRSQNLHQQISADDLSPQQIRDIQNALVQLCLLPQCQGHTIFRLIEGISSGG